MSSLYNRLAASTERLSVVTGAAANLIAQLSELNELRERVKRNYRPEDRGGQGSNRTRI